MAMFSESPSRYSKQLSDTFNENLLKLNLTEKVKISLKEEWLQPTIMFEQKAKTAQQWYWIIRLSIIIIGIAIPALIGINLYNSQSQKYLNWTILGLSSWVAVAAIVDERLHLGEKYRDNREAAENMKSEWWRFCQLTVPYQRYLIHNDAYGNSENDEDENNQYDDTFIKRIKKIKSRANQSKQIDEEDKKVLDQAKQIDKEDKSKENKTGSKSYLDWLRQNFTQQIDNLKLSGEDKDSKINYLKNRWLDQTIFYEKRATLMQSLYRNLRLCVVIGGVIIPALIGLQLNNPVADFIKSIIAIGVSLAVASCAAVEEFFNFGEKYRNYRKAAETMKSEWWKFQNLTGRYDKFSDIETAIPTFVQRVEQIIDSDLQNFIEMMDEQLTEDRKENQKAIDELNISLKSQLEAINQSVDSLNDSLKYLK